MAMTKEEKLNLALKKATLLSEQGRFAEARFAYENIIEDLRSRKKVTKRKTKRKPKN